MNAAQRLLLPLLAAALFASPALAYRKTPTTHEKPAKVSPSPRQVVKAFYSHHFHGDMAFTEQSIAAKEPWLASELLADAIAETQRPRAADEVPEINGDPFTNSQEYPTRFDVGSTFVPEPGVARVPVIFQGNKRWDRVVVVLQLEGGAWKVRDIETEQGTSLAFFLRAQTREIAPG